MPIAIKPAIIKDFFLTESDKKLGSTEDPTKIVVRQCTTGDNERRNSLFAEFRRTLEPNGDIVITQRVSFDDIKRLEVFLSLADCNIIDTTDDKGHDAPAKPLFTFSNGRLTNEAAFKVAWGKLPQIVADEIYQKILEMNPMWSSDGDAPLSQS